MQLKVTCDTSASSVEFLDIVIHKGTRWLTEGRFDLYTYQKKLNLYGYMPYRSAHPIHRKRGFITGELLRYVATNTDKDSFNQICRGPWHFVRWIPVAIIMVVPNLVRLHHH